MNKKLLRKYYFYFFSVCNVQRKCLLIVKSLLKLQILNLFLNKKGKNEISWFLEDIIEIKKL